MSVRIIHDEEQGLANLYQSETDVAFGPVFYAEGGSGYSALQIAEKFVEWANLRNTRLWLFRPEQDLMDKYHEFQQLEWKECPECYDKLCQGWQEACDKCLHECDECGDTSVETVKMKGLHNTNRRICEDCRKACRKCGETVSEAQQRENDPENQICTSCLQNMAS